MAREAGGLNCDCCLPEPEPHEMQEFIERFAALVAEHILSELEYLPGRQPVQVPVAEFVEMVLEKEHLVGKPLVWAQWPNEEKK